MSKKKAFVRYANNKLVPASVFIGAKAPAVGRKWTMYFKVFSIN